MLKRKICPGYCTDRKPPHDLADGTASEKKDPKNAKRKKEEEIESKLVRQHYNFFRTTLDLKITQQK